MVASASRSLAFIALFGFVAFVSTSRESTSSRDLASAFDASISPCEDMYGHVCAYKNPVIKWFLNETNQPLMQLVQLVDLNETIYNSTFREFRKFFADPDRLHIIKCKPPKLNVSTEPDDETFGRDLGRLYATAGCLNSKCEAELEIRCDLTIAQMRCTVGEPGENMNFSAVYRGLEHKLVKGIVYGYLHALEVPDEQIARIERPEENRKRRLQMGLWAGVNFLAPYFNVLLAKTMLDHPEKFHVNNELIVKDMEVFLNKIRKGIGEKILKTDYLSSEQKSAIGMYLNDLEIIVGLPQEYRSPEKIDALYAKARNIISNYTKSLTGEKDCTEQAQFTNKNDCDCTVFPAMLGRMSIFRKQHAVEKLALLMPTQENASFETSLFAPDIIRQGNLVHILPGFVNSLPSRFLNDLPMGFKYGYVAWQFARRVFEGLGLNFNGDMEALAGISRTRQFRNAKNCYEEFYGGLCKTENNKTMCPDGSKSSDGGFADVESARLVFSLFEDELAKRRKAKEEIFAAGQTEEQWFFKSMQLTKCNPDIRNEEHYFNEPGPRPQAQFNAVAMQMKNFTKSFRCRKTTPNYASGFLCNAYSLSTDYNHIAEDDSTDKPMDEVTGAALVEDPIDATKFSPLSESYVSIFAVSCLAPMFFS
ncbi:hypothetical protein L596_023515 [Steinernema carpocapsae]|uniref:Peptidase M13 C-terminal domain-containing protein n=1 Tax=Steinernema carpocapsae TaxID=34508 RepID=A0A4U5MDX4_STECR|nr:hypothetical protein L596_023515 [Steinernema carpocapsae]